MRSFYFILILVIAAFMFMGLYYVRMEMSKPGHVGRIERAERDLGGDLGDRSSSRVLVVPPGNTVTIQPPASPAPVPLVIASPKVETTPPPSPGPANPPPTPKVDMTYRLIERLYKKPQQVRAPNLDFFNREIVTTIPGTLHLRFQGVSTEIEYPIIEAKVATADLFTVGGIYTREQINAAKK
jgi:hypothetical protein